MFGPQVTLSANTPKVDLMGDNQRIKLLKAYEYDKMYRPSVQMWAHKHGRYGLPTFELIEWLKDQIGDRKAIEIGSGHGDLCYHLGILGTDNWCQQLPDVAAYYRAQGQPVIKYASDVEKLDGLAAVEKYRPSVVVGSWVTQWISSGPKGAGKQGSMYGIREDRILKTGVTYIMIGNLGSHNKKEILKKPHEEHRLPFVRSRASDPDLDRVFIWRGWK